jgi:hypothetical protein
VVNSGARVVRLALANAYDRRRQQTHAVGGHGTGRFVIDTSECTAGTKSPRQLIATRRSCGPSPTASKRDETA